MQRVNSYDYRDYEQITVVYTTRRQEERRKSEESQNVSSSTCNIVENYT